MSYLDKIKVGEAEYDIKDPSAARSTDIGNGTLTIQKNGTTVASFSANQTTAQTANITVPTAPADINAQAALSETQLTAVNSGITSTNVSQIATNTSDIDTIEVKIPEQASASNQLADKNFVNSSVATNTANYISNNGEPFASLADLQAYSGTLTNNDYAFVVGTDAAGNTTYTRYKYNASTATWAEEYVLNNSSFTSAQWGAINSGITGTAVTKLNGIEAGAEVNDIDSISLNGTALTPDANKNVEITTPTYSDFTGTDGTAAGAHGLVPAPATTDAGKFLKADGTWDDAGSSVNVVQTTGTSTADVMSQNAVTSMVFADPGTNTKPKLGSGPQSISGKYGAAVGGANAVMGEKAIALAYGADARARGSVGLGAHSNATRQGEIACGTNDGIYGYSSSYYRLISGVYDGQSAHDAATFGQLDTRLGGMTILQITQTDYDALATKDPNTLYVITGA